MANRAGVCNGSLLRPLLSDSEDGDAAVSFTHVLVVGFDKHQEGSVLSAESEPFSCFAFECRTSATPNGRVWVR